MLIAAAPARAQPPQPPAARTQSVTAPLKDGVVYVGDLLIAVSPDGQISFSSRAFAALVGPRLRPELVRDLEARASERGVFTPADVELLGLEIVYNPQTVELQILISPDQRGVGRVSLGYEDTQREGPVEEPAALSGFLTARTSLDHLTQSFTTPHEITSFTALLDGAVRWRGVVLESQGTIETQVPDQGFIRRGTRFVYDDQQRRIRYALGDLRTTGRSFQNFPEMAGMSVSRLYALLEPTRVIQPGGERRFRLNATSNVDILINGRVVRRLRLDPGTYDLANFPLVEGANDVIVRVEDETGVREDLTFSMFMDRAQLAKGLTEFGAYLGVAAPQVDGRPTYTDNPTFSGWLRHGLTDTLTIGLNGQADENAAMLGVEAAWGTPIGVVGLELAASGIGAEKGGAGRITFSRELGPIGALDVFVEKRSADFVVVGEQFPSYPFEYELGLTWSRSLGRRFYTSTDLSYRKGRGETNDQQLYRLTLGYEPGPRVSLNLDVAYEDRNAFKGVTALLTLNLRLGERTTSRAEYDSRFERTRLDLRSYGGENVGAWNAGILAETAPELDNLTGDYTYTSNRAELGVNVAGAWRDGFETFLASRTTLRAASSIAFADGAVAFGRPIYDGFAILAPHRDLKGATVYAQPTTESYQARSGRLGPALVRDVNAYTDQAITIDVEGAPPGYDLGPGAYHLYAPYRSGYRLQVGSDYSLTVFAVLKDHDGAPLALMGGTATELAKPKREPIEIFTNRLGRLAASGLRPGRWRFDMGGRIYLLDIPDSPENIIELGEISPQEDAP